MSNEAGRPESDRERLVALLNQDYESSRSLADRILAACEIKFREPEETEREKVARALCEASLSPGGWPMAYRPFYLAQADYALKLRDDAWNAAIEAVLGVARVKCWSDDAENAIRALKREAK